MQMIDVRQTRFFDNILDQIAEQIKITEVLFKA